MSFRSTVACFIAFCCFLCLPLSHASEYEPADILLAKSAGIWESGGEYGYFKVIVYREGIEHSSDKVRVLVTKANPDLNTQTIVNDFEIKSPGTKGYVNDLALKVVNNRLAVGLDIEMKAMDGIILRESFLVDTKGHVKLLSPAKHTDIYAK